MKTLLVSTALVLATGLGASAQTATTAGTNSGAAASAPAAATSVGAASNVVIKADPSDLQATNLIGMDVYTTGGAQPPAEVQKIPDAWKDIGSIGDLVISRDGQVKAVVVNVGGFLGIGEHTVALKMEGLKLVKRANTQNPYDFVIAVADTKKSLEDAPVYKTPEQKRSEQASAANGSSGMATGAAAGGATGGTMAPAPAPASGGMTGTAPQTQTAQAGHKTPEEQGFHAVANGQITADQIKGADVYQKSKNEDIGKVSKVILDGQGEMTQTVVSTGGVLGLGSKDVVLPKDQMELMQSKDGKTIRVYVSMSEKQLLKLPKYKG